MPGLLRDRTALRNLSAQMNCLEIPFRFGRVNRIGNEGFAARFIFKGGVYLSCGINGKGTATWEESDLASEERISNVFKDESLSDRKFRAFSRFDFGIRLGSEFQIKDYLVRISYSPGVLKVHPT